MTLAPWDYLFEAFNSANFGDLFWPTVVVSILMLVGTVLLYNFRTQQLRAHEPYLDLYEWLLWTGVITYSLLIIYAVFVFDFFFVLLTILIGAGMFLWIRFIHFPPILTSYEQALAKQRYFARQRVSRPEATIRSSRKSSKRRR